MSIDQCSWRGPEAETPLGLRGELFYIEKQEVGVLRGLFLFPNTKLTKNIIQQIIRRNGPRDLTQVVQRLPDIHR